MQTLEMEIPKERWGAFLDVLSREVLDRPVRLELEAMDLGDQPVGSLLPLRGLDYETKGSQAGDLLILMGSDAEPQAHRIPRPSRLFVGFDEQGQPLWLAFEQEDGGKALLFLEQLERLSATPGEPPGPEPARSP